MGFDFDEKWKKKEPLCKASERKKRVVFIRAQQQNARTHRDLFESRFSLSCLFPLSLNSYSRLISLFYVFPFGEPPRSLARWFYTAQTNTKLPSVMFGHYTNLYAFANEWVHLWFDAISLGGCNFSKFKPQPFDIHIS